MLMGATSPTLSRRLILGWGIGSLGASVLHNGISFLALFFLTSVLGMPAAVAGTLILAAKLYDIVTDPLMGWLSDRTRSRWGRRRPWLVAGAIVSGLAFVLLFNPPGTSGTGLLVAAGAALVLYATGYTLFGIPYLAMPAEMTEDAHERSRLMSARTLFLTLGILGGGALAPALAGAFGGGPDGYGRMGWVLGGLIVMTMLLSFLGTHGARQTSHDADRPALPTADAWRSALGNRPFVALIACKFSHLVGVALSMSSLAFLVTGSLGQPEASMGGFVLASAVGSIGTLPLWLRLSRTLGKRNTYLWGAACYVPVLLSWLLAEPGESTAVFWLRGLATGIATGGLTLTAQAMLPDAIAHDFARTGLRREAMFTAVYSVAEKLASASGPFLLALALASAGNRGVLLTAVVLPAIATTLSALALLAYRLDPPGKAA
jgi:GPH family glycoside/pentoside/hexuronide:cation symporter